MLSQLTIVGTLRMTYKAEHISVNIWILHDSRQLLRRDINSESNNFFPLLLLLTTAIFQLKNNFWRAPQKIRIRMLRRGSGKVLCRPQLVGRLENSLHTDRNLKLFCWLILSHSHSWCCCRGLERLFIAEKSPENKFLAYKFCTSRCGWFLWLERFMINVTLIIAFKVFFISWNKINWELFMRVLILGIVL